MVRWVKKMFVLLVPVMVLVNVVLVLSFNGVAKQKRTGVLWGCRMRGWTFSSWLWPLMTPGVEQLSSFSAVFQPVSTTTWVWSTMIGCELCAMFIIVSCAVDAIWWRIALLRFVMATTIYTGRILGSACTVISGQCLALLTPLYWCVGP